MIYPSQCILSVGRLCQFVLELVMLASVTGKGDICFLHSKVTILPFTINKEFVARYFKII